MLSRGRAGGFLADGRPEEAVEEPPLDGSDLFDEGPEDERSTNALRKRTESRRAFSID